jgi:hypothetical protein
MNYKCMTTASPARLSCVSSPAVEGDFIWHLKHKTESAVIRTVVAAPALFPLQVELASARDQSAQNLGEQKKFLNLRCEITALVHCTLREIRAEWRRAQ